MIAQQLSPDAPERVGYQAAFEAEAQRKRYLESGESFCVETVFSHTSKVEFVRNAREREYQVNLIYIHLSTGLYAARVLDRVDKGGHSVPPEKIEPRVHRLRANVRETLALCDYVGLYDNSDSERPFELVLSIHDGIVHRHQTPLPAWVHDLAGASFTDR
ncbi:MAG: zeta toxin family protein [Gammaproteobacteria bacterium]|nr:zeta toxin family protein [Gammaproteobacteria bacterium]